MGQDVSLKSKWKNPWFKPWFNIFGKHNQLCVPQYKVNVSSTWYVYITLPPPPSSKQLRTFYIVLTLFHVTKHELSTDPLPPSLVNVVCERFLWEFFLANCCTAAMRSELYMWHLHMSWPIRTLTFTFVFRIKVNVFQTIVWSSNCA